MMAMLQMPCRPCSPACHGLLWCRATAHTQLGASRASSPVSRRRQRLARCTALQHAQADALVSDILQEIKDTGVAAQLHGITIAVVAHVSAERLADQDTLLQMAD